MLKQRLLTAMVLLPLFVWAVLAMPVNGFALLLLLFVIQGAWEWSGLMQLRQTAARVAYCVLLILCLLSAAYFINQESNWLRVLLFTAQIGWLIAFVLVVSYPKNIAWWNNAWAKGISGLFLLVPCWIALVYLKVHAGSGGYWLLLLFILIWSADSGAYFSGRRFGKNKLAPQVSPGKSWEGVIGGAIAAAAAVLLVLYSRDEVLGASQYFPLSFLVVLTVAFSVLGDLFESLAKRVVGVKDSGSLLPGHGGVLDRIDSVTAAAPLFALGLILISGQSEFPRF